MPRGLGKNKVLLVLLPLTRLEMERPKFPSKIYFFCPINTAENCPAVTLKLSGGDTLTYVEMLWFRLKKKKKKTQ